MNKDKQFLKTILSIRKWAFECLIFIYHHHCDVVPVMNEIRFWTNCSGQHFLHLLLRKGLTCRNKKGNPSFTARWCFPFPFQHQLTCHGAPPAPSCPLPGPRATRQDSQSRAQRACCCTRAGLGLTLSCRCHSSSNLGLDHSSQDSQGHQDSMNKAVYLLKLKLLNLPKD